MREIDSVRAKIDRLQKQRDVEYNAMRKQAEGLAERRATAATVKDELLGFEKELAAREARLRMMKGGIKEVIMANSVVRAFQMSQEDAAAKIQSIYRGNQDRKRMADKKIAPVETEL